MEQTGKKQGWMDSWKERSVVAGGSSIKENEESRGGEGGVTRKTEKEAASERERRSLDFNAIRNSSPPFITGRPSPPSPFLPTNEFTQYFVPSFNLVSLNFSFTFGASLLLKSR